MGRCFWEIFYQKQRLFDDNYTNTRFKMPKSPNKIKIILDKISIILFEMFLLIHFPKNIANELLITIPNIEPKIKEILYKGYCIPNPNEAKKVLSPISPIVIEDATRKIQL